MEFYEISIAEPSVFKMFKCSLTRQFHWKIKNSQSFNLDHGFLLNEYAYNNILVL